jgi:hypothetical protein
MVPHTKEAWESRRKRMRAGSHAMLTQVHRHLVATLCRYRQHIGVLTLPWDLPTTTKRAMEALAP